MKRLPSGNKIKQTIKLNEIKDFAAWYKGQSYFNLCQLQDGFGYSSAAGFVQAFPHKVFTVIVDNCGNILPVV